MPISNHSSEIRIFALMKVCLLGSRAGGMAMPSVIFNKAVAMA
jgi:hypothetical protein